MVEPLRIGVDAALLESATGVREALERLGDVCDVDAPDVAAIVCRSTTKVTPAWLEARPGLRWIASSTSGEDHLDASALAERGVRWTTVPGANAEAVADWVEVALDRLGVGPEATVGVVGVGHVGRAVARRIEAHGGRVLRNDPPRAAAEPDFDHVGWDRILAEADAITVHTPLDATTRGLVDSVKLAGFKGRALLSAARGGVVDEASARAWAGRGGLLALDVFAGEPRPDPATIAACAFATPHVAGHTGGAKAEALRRCAAWLAEQTGATAPLRPIGELPGLPEARSALDGVHHRLAAGEDFATVRDSGLRRSLRP